MRHAVIGIGSNSTRLLVGDIDQGTITDVLRMREGTRLFAGLEDGSLSTESMMRTIDAVGKFVRAAQEAKAEQIHVIATSATRDAANAQEFAELIEAITGETLAVISGEEEARLSFLGSAGQGYCGMVDIGGGSTEIAVGGSGRPMQSTSVQLGAVRLFGEVPVLLGDGLDKAYAQARSLAQADWTQLDVTHPPAAWYGVGGTMTCLASLDMQLPAFDRDQVAGHGLTRGAVENWARRLAKMSIKEREALPGMLRQRADIIAHGAIVLWAVMDVLAIGRISVSNRTNLDGYLIDLVAAPRAQDTAKTVQSYYDASVEQEWARLERGYFEFEINKHYIDRYIQPGSRVLDVGGGPGRYSLHLAERGVDVTLVDLSPGNVAFAQERARAMGLSLPGHACDARIVDETVEGQFDAILLMGPLYHLLTEEDRTRAVEACLRRLRPGGLLFVAFISMMAGMIYAARELPSSILWEGEDMFYNKIEQGEDFAGQAFTQAFFIQPDHVLPFMERFPLNTMHLVGSESITAPFHGKLMEAEPEVRAAWLKWAMKMCERKEFLAYTVHLLYIGRKKEET